MHSTSLLGLLKEFLRQNLQNFVHSALAYAFKNTTLVKYNNYESTLPKNDLLSHLNWGAQVLMEISSNV